ncbi:hypothetical protein H4R26_003582 [Coemansia thaxteri]|uniref:Minor histocompatibility antigen H13 n=1 Tax=Coemansia thaxteri TaxID=2663907 RepID=A0A9W8BAX2_9FUNG|nr:hypothetical protein H4R26_003582 [Coemansia thaxteri]
MSETGLFAAYAAIGTMAVLPIYYGSFSSLDRLKSAASKKKAREKGQFAEYSDSEDEDGDESEAVTAEDAYMFPVYGSAALFSMYLVFKYLSKEWVNFLLSGYFALLGVAALTQVGVRVAKGVTGVKLPLYHLNLVHHSKSVFDVRFTNLHLGTMGAAMLCTGWYLWSKDWVVSNLFGLAFSFSAINLIRLDSFRSGMIMLGGLFAYDIFWVFGTEVMVSVAKNFDAPIKLVFPKDLFPASGKLAFTMLGLGDIVVPGIFVALCLRFDRHRYLETIGYAPDKALPRELNHKHRVFGFPTPYFKACMAAYVAGLATTITVMHTFKAAQPALLYLSPACMLAVLVTGVLRGELAAVFGYKEAKKDKDSDDDAKAKGAGKDDKAPAVAHRYNLRNQAAGGGLTTPASAGELADDEQENVRAAHVLDDKVNPISEVSSESEAAGAAPPATPAKGAAKGKKTAKGKAAKK